MNELKNYILILTVFCTVNIFAQHDHGSHGAIHTNNVEQPPHNGVVKTVGKYKIEMVTNAYLKKDQLTFYLFKGNFKPIPNEGITGELIIRKTDGTSKTQTLKMKGDDFFVAQMDGLESFTCTVKFIIKEKTITANFSHKGLDTNTTIKKEEQHGEHQH